MSKNLNSIINEKINLPYLELKHCNKFYDYLAEIKPISDYNFTENKISICLNRIGKTNEYTNQTYLKEEKLIFFESLFLKEFSYFYDFNKTYSNKRINLSDKAKITINACKLQIKHKIKNENLINNNSNSQTISEINLDDELIRRCSYVDFKYKFFDDIEFEAAKTDKSINELVKKYIDSNF